MTGKPNLYGQLRDALSQNWRLKARPSQLPPAGEWSGWLVLAGRGFGKTWLGTSYVNELAETKAARRIALIAPTAADTRDVLVEGESGILATAPSWNRPEYEPSKRRLTWANGATALLFSAEEPERLRGPQFDFVYADELAAWNNVQATWDQCMFTLRLGRLNGVREEAKAGQRTTLDVLNAQQALVNARVALVTAQHDRVVASYSVLNSIGRLSPQVLNLRTTTYDPSVHYQQVRDSWFGIRTPDGR